MPFGSTIGKTFKGLSVTRKPSLPPTDDPRFLDSIKECLEQGQGLRGDSRDRTVTFRDLENSSIAEVIVSNGIAAIPKKPTVGGATDGGSANGQALTKPENVRDFVAEGTFSFVILSWKYPDYVNHAFTEIAKSQTNNISTAITIGYQPANMHNDEVGNEFSAYYWIRHVSTSGVKGAWSQPQQASTPRFEDIIPEAVIGVAKIKDGFFDNLTAVKGKITEANIRVANIFNALVENYIQSANYLKGVRGWRIDKGGDAEFNNLNVRGLVHNGDLDSNGNPTGDSRYIDFRSGIDDGYGNETNGNFLLGDIDEFGEGDYISYKYEPEIGRKVLRVRGDILLKQFYPGDYLYHNNNLSSTIEAIPRITYNGFKSIKNDVQVIPIFGTPPFLTYYIVSKVSEINEYMKDVAYGIRNSSELDRKIVKSTYVYGAGILRVVATGTARLKVSGTVVNSFVYPYTVPIIALAIKKRETGVTTFVTAVTPFDIITEEYFASPANMTVNWSFDREVAVNFGDEVQIITSNFLLIVNGEFTPDPKTELSNYPELTTNDMDFGGRVVSSNLKLYVNAPFETISLK